MRACRPAPPAPHPVDRSMHHARDGPKEPARGWPVRGRRWRRRAQAQAVHEGGESMPAVLRRDMSALPEDVVAGRRAPATCIASIGGDHAPCRRSCCVSSPQQSRGSAGRRVRGQRIVARASACGACWSVTWTRTDLEPPPRSAIASEKPAMQVRSITACGAASARPARRRCARPRQRHGVARDQCSSEDAVVRRPNVHARHGVHSAQVLQPTAVGSTPRCGAARRGISPSRGDARRGRLRRSISDSASSYVERPADRAHSPKSAMLNRKTRLKAATRPTSWHRAARRGRWRTVV